MMKIKLLLFITIIYKAHGENKCAAREIPNESVVCVCNSTYCDDFVREPPKRNAYVAYTSSKSGLRFVKTEGHWGKQEEKCSTSLTLDPTIKYQRVEGFGGAVTDAASINWKSMPEELQKHLIRSYFSKYGLEYNMMRVPIGGTDFSTHPYAYNELPENDTLLTNYTLTIEDRKYKIPMIKAAMQEATSPIHLVATTWSPPLWMKTVDTYGGYSQLKKKYYQTYADYHLKFLQHYNKYGIPIWGMTTTNEPINGMFSFAKFNSMGWTVKNMGHWIVDNLGPTIRNSTFKDLKIITGDDQRITVPYWFNIMLRETPNALDYIDGIGVHYYTDQFVPAVIFETVTKTYPNKFIIGTEACEGSFPWQKEKVILGSWKRAQRYIDDIIQDLSYNLIGWIDWNLCLDMRGGPNWANNFVDSPIIVNAKSQEFYKQPMFYAMGHFSKFIPRGSVRIEVEKSFTIFSHLNYVAFLTPRDTIVVVVHNKGKKQTISVKCGSMEARVDLEEEAVTTLELPYENNEFDFGK
ncbi:lysosomal acid glucosylceramidase isoform X2 [Aricia agestis]|uniref:lysosomal acid glucosylceramidase isoform X2 n=1 Tax=Aricia agestis TaxID=91739 RepID=UPI001C20AD9B|nr:lysosomal acid glucosylceramidase isoform X2 [Aricia agestis]